MSVIILVCVVVRCVFYDSSMNNEGYYEQCNKICYFMKSVMSGGDVNDYTDEDLPVGSIREFHSYFPENEFVDNRFPFLSTEKNDDVLGDFFDLGDKKPNIVVVIVEGLGRENSGKYSKYISSTPFLDSLAEHSLYWLNCMSASQRTAGVFPAIFGALPCGREGFMAYKRNAPSFNSLPKILEENGYKFSFYYGGNSNFDNMDDFMNLNGGEQGFAEKHPELTERSQWGLLDKCLFSEAVKSIDFKSSKPRFEVYMTLTCHAPWDYPDRDSYIQRYKKMKPTQGQLPYKDVTTTAAYLYTDEAIRQLLTDYSKQEGFENTIFIITGDHNFYTIAFEKYHVPLLVWSPMLKKNKMFPALVSHREIAPTLISMLKNKYKIKTPEEVAWINSSLDTASVFRGKSFTPQMDASRNIANMMYHDFYVDNNEVYRMSYQDNWLNLNQEKDSAAYILKLFDIYKKLDKYVCDNDKLIDAGEDSDYRWADVDTLNPVPKDTINTNKTFPLEPINISLKSEYQALKVQFGFDLIFDEETANRGFSCAIQVEVYNDKGEKTYRGFSEIRSFDELVKHYEFSEILKTSNYGFKDGGRLKVFMINWSNVPIKIANVRNSVKVAYNTSSSGNDEKIWAHRVNDPDEANIKTKYFKGIEVDLVFDDDSGELFVSHELDKEKMSLTFREYLQKLENPERCSFWLDVKNLDKNAVAICDTILSLAESFGFKQQFFVESWHCWALKTAKEKGLKISLWVTNLFDGKEHDTLIWKEKTEKYVSVCDPDALSAYYRMRPLLDEYFPDRCINLWQTPADYNDENVKITREICCDPHVKVLLVDYDEPILY